jgi:hypoxanthine phosphoribosyltransferase
MYNEKKRKVGQPTIHILWDDFIRDCQLLANKLPRNATIYGIPRNGTIIACILSHLREDIKVFVDEIDDVAVRMSPDIIVVDDISDSGNTLAAFPRNQKATLWWRQTSRIKPDYHTTTLHSDMWVILPWEKE